MADNDNKQGFIRKIFSAPNDDPKKTIVVAFLLCLVCSILVSISAVMFRPLQQANKANDIKKNILGVSGLLTTESDIKALFSQFEVKLVDLETGDYSDLDPATYNQRKASSDPARSMALSTDQDIANIGRRANLAKVYLLKENGQLKQVILPVHGYGLWSTLYGFVSLEADYNTIRGLQFYAHAETPGLGGEVDNPKWRKQWQGKQAFNDAGELKIEVIRGHVSDNTADAQHKVDGLSGATLTSRGVSNLVRFWLSENGFGPYLMKMHARAEG
ncbi:MAG: Na(+)-translocating NADH-quinone reductase subunit C [Gammaproteobacteria bacterium]|nr:Na(+)-translocating NADH-quinone reductase subunit C [Gammaproteobacteria bacterium]